jgi:2-amino-4-hydroxy-6-hydroxymethyldihydropteridine diphosphokinase
MSGPSAEDCCLRGELTYFLGLGSNLGDRRKNLSRAVRLLGKADVRVVRTSSVYETEPVDDPAQPWYLNQVLEVRTAAAPHELLLLAKDVEARLGRSPGPAGAPRTMDIDILLAEETIIDTPDLTIPHPRLARRNFVLVPLGEIAPKTMHPVLRKSVKELARASSDRSRVVRLP